MKCSPVPTNQRFGLALIALVLAALTAGACSGGSNSSSTTIASTTAAAAETTNAVSGPVVTATKGATAEGQAGCSAASCRWVSVSLSGFIPNSEVTLSCEGSNPSGVFHTTSVTVDGSGAWSDTAVCYWGYPGETVTISTSNGISDSISNW